MQTLTVPPPGRPVSCRTTAPDAGEQISAPHLARKQRRFPTLTVQSIVLQLASTSLIN